MSDELMQGESVEPESDAETLERDDFGRFVVEPEPESAPVVVEPEPEPEPEPAPTPTPVSVGKPKRKPAPSTVPSAVGAVTVSLSALVYQSRARNSASVSAVQDRLAELGYGDARADIRGWMSDGTVKALSDFQSASGLEVSGKATPETVEALMRGTGAIVTP